MSPVSLRTPPDRPAVTDDDIDAPASAIRLYLPLFAVPGLVVSLDSLRFLPLDARGAYVASLMDGRCSVETILDICEMNRAEVLDSLARLVELGAIELHDP
jgi:hypothetical protein